MNAWKRRKMPMNENKIEQVTIERVFKFLSVCQPEEQSCDGCPHGKVDDCILHGHKEALDLFVNLLSEYSRLKCENKAMKEMLKKAGMEG